MRTIYSQIDALLNRCDTDFPIMPPTQLYNEGWMLRLILDRFASLDLKHRGHPLALPANGRWYSEALLPSAFLRRSSRDPLAESWTHADGVIGDFSIGDEAKGDLSLQSDAKHFVVLEAKMFSKLSAGVKNAPYFNQAARIVACCAEVLRRAGRPGQEFRALGFYVLAPSSQIEQGVFANQLTKAELQRVVKQRVSEYSGKKDKWFSDWFLPTLDCLDIQSLSWEAILDFLIERDTGASDLKEFYRRCLQFNKSPVR